MKITHWNLALEKRTGGKERSHFGPVRLRRVSQQRPEPEQEAITLAQQGEKVRLTDLPICSREGYFDIDVVPLYGPEGAIAGSLSLSRDVTARHQAAQKLQYAQRCACSDQ